MKKLFKNISTAFLILSLILLLYVTYRAELYHSGTAFEYYLKYYVISFILIFLSAVSFLLKNDLKIKISSILISTLIGLYIVESFLIFKKAQMIKSGTFVSAPSIEKIKTYKKQTGNVYDIRSKFEIYSDLKKEDANVVMSIPPGNFINELNQKIFQFSGISNSKTIHCNENGYYSIYQSDRYGFNNPDNEWDKKEIDFLLLGDSYTEGACVNEEDTISGNLKKISTNVVLNLGQTGNGPLIEYATLREYLPIKKTKRVLWIYYEGSDLMNLASELKNPILLKYLTDENFSQNLISKQEIINKKLFLEIDNKIKVEKERLDNIKYYYFKRFIKLYSIRELLLPTPTSNKFKNVIKKSKEFANDNNSKFYFIYLPDSRFLKNKNYRNSKNYEKVISIVNDLNIPIIDINKELFKDHEDPLSLFPFRGAGHYNELGYKQVANAIFKRIKQIEK